MSDKRLGYVLIVFSLLLAVGFVFTFFRATSGEYETRTLRFPQVGSLMIEDPVRMEGVLVAEVSGFDFDNSGFVLVQIRSRESVPIRTSSDVAVKVKGVMGERFIEISTGDLGDPLIEKGQIVKGRFEMGPSEAITYMDVLEDKIHELRDVMLWLRDGRDDGKRPFAVAFPEIVTALDTIVTNVFTTLYGMEDDINSAVGTAVDLVDATVRMTATVGAQAPKLVDDLTTMMERVDRLADKVDTLIVRLDPVVARIDTSNVLWGDHAERIQKVLPEIRSYIEWIREVGIPLTIRLRVF